jgi:hypothetical protein
VWSGSRQIRPARRAAGAEPVHWAVAGGNGSRAC